MKDANITEYNVTISNTGTDFELKTWTFTDKDQAIAKRNACVCGPSTTLESQRHYNEWYITVDWDLDGLGSTCDDIDTLFANDVHLTD